MPHTKTRLSFFVMLALSFSSLCFAQDDPRTLRRAEQLLAAPTEVERQALLAAEKELVTRTLMKSLLTQGERPTGPASSSSAMEDDVSL